MPDVKIGIWLALALGSVGLALVAVAAFSAAKRFRMGNNWIYTTGAVVGFREVTTTSRAEDGPGGANGPGRVTSATSFPIVEFVDEAGTTRRFDSKFGAMDGALKQLPVVYPASDPTQAEVHHWFAQTGWMIVTGGIGLILCVVAMYVRNQF